MIAALFFIILMMVVVAITALINRADKKARAALSRDKGLRIKPIDSQSRVEAQNPFEPSIDHKNVVGTLERNFLLKMGFMALSGVILFSVMGVLVNLVINFQAFQFQFGFRRHVDTALLNDYKLVRNIFLFVGLLAGLASAFKEKPKDA